MCSSDLVEMDRANDVAQIALVERHKATGKVVNAFVSGFGYTKDCALASTVAHDSHHMIVVGTNKEDMAQAANILKDIGGGLVLVSEGKELARVEMPIAGLMSDERAEIVAEKLGLPVAIDPDLREVNWGVQEGKPMAEWFSDWAYNGYAPEGGETLDALQTRAVAGVNRAVLNPAEVLIVEIGRAHV